MDQQRESEIERLQRELDFRMAVTTAIVGTLELEPIFYIILSGITSGKGMGFNRAFLFLADESGRQLRIRLAVGPTSAHSAEEIWAALAKHDYGLDELLPRCRQLCDDAETMRLTAQLGDFNLALNGLDSVAAPSHILYLNQDSTLEAVLSRCILNQAPFCSNALTMSYPQIEEAEMSFRHFAIVPLAAGDRLIGAIVADNYFNRRPVGADELRSLQSIGNLAAMAIDRAQLHERTVAMAEVDGLTGVYNRRYYEKALVDSLALVKRSGHGVAVVIFDVDHFKRVNDNFGHLAGDQLLREIAQLLLKNVRQVDRVARYGGEEFVVLLDDADVDAAIQVAEKLRQTVHDADFVDGRIGRVTLSAGVAAAREEDTADTFFQRADSALYRAKSEGRDRVVFINAVETSEAVS
jgi:diguanylate cyclase (GGDEF)-like protein